MLRNPCKLCLVKVNCSEICNEKKAREKNLENISLIPMFVFLAIGFLACIMYDLFLMLLKKSKILSSEKYDQMNPFRHFDPSDPFLF